ncbi:MAG: glycoside hydrolase family 3 protein [Atopobiaceae bacterium]
MVPRNGKDDSLKTGRGRAMTRRGALGLAAGLAMLGVAGCSSCGKQDDAADAGTDAQDTSASAADTSNEDAQEQTPQPTAEELAAQHVEDLLGALTTEQKVSQLFFIRPESIVSDTMTEAGSEAQQALSAYPVGGMCFFGKNLEDTDQTVQMLSALKTYSKDACGLPLLCSTDEEGGTVSRIGGTPGFGIANVGDMRAIGDAGDVSAARDVAVTIGNYLLPLGFNLDFAPDADICNNPDSDTMAQRSFGTTAAVVAPMVGAQVQGFISCGIGCCAKHFPGIGGAVGDSETEPIVSEKTADEMAEEELKPFQAAIAAGVPMIMVGHLSCPNITGTYAPASISKEIVTDMLRDRLGFDGVIITDSLEMGAIVQDYTIETIVLSALDAGVDMLLMPSDFDRAYTAVLSAVESGAISEDRVDDSVRRIIKMKVGLGLV